MRKRFDFILMATLAGLAGAIIPVAAVAALFLMLVFGMWLNDATPESQYYRGLYDVCMARYKQTETCLRIVADLQDKGLYQMESPGWAWPLPEPGPTPRPKGDLNG